jgi:hypothetical protein
MSLDATTRAFGFATLKRAIGRLGMARLRGSCSDALDCSFEQASELPGEADGDACVHDALPVEESLRAAETEDTFVPDVRVDVETLAAVEAKGDEALRRHIVARQGERYDGKRAGTSTVSRRA